VLLVGIRAGTRGHESDTAFHSRAYGGARKRGLQ